ncbi:hypothetical protein MXAN_6896 [Myxococcus xanthus DK 1622]|uniref:Uncharacterized protein n=1 Tax=Myxococcus xanthus (strain DK1622) TaxID=246197 RepID=Q1CX63_MYXXD|nr:hypothetical protein MXAN_6896 [Myxococcus xanthus DK 1622]
MLHEGTLSTQRPLAVSHCWPAAHWLLVVHSTQVGVAPGVSARHWVPLGQQLQELPAHESLVAQGEHTLSVQDSP